MTLGNSLTAILCGPLWCALLVLWPGGAAADEIRHYDWLTAGKVSGAHVLTIGEDGTRVSEFEFNDRGRGPKLHEILRVASDGLLVGLDVTGHSYLGAPADEHFRVENGQASWESTVEQGEAQAGGFYWANDGTAEQLAVLARALLRASRGELPILPDGRARISTLGEHEIATDGSGRTVTLYSISGLGLSPRYIWLDANQELFGQVMGGMGMTPRGLSAALPQLQEIQNQAEAAHQRELASALTRTLPRHWILKNVGVIDVESGQRKDGQMVWVQDGIIRRIEDDRALDLPVYGDLEPRIVDGQGLTLIPGLWDMHTHLSLEDGLLQIAAGVTHVRDLGNDPERLENIQKAFDNGEVIGPHSLAAGVIDGRSPFSAPTDRLAGNLDEALHWVRDYAALGYPQIKLYSSIDPQWVRPLADEIHRLGMRVSGHVPAFMKPEQAVRDGYDEIQHINMLFLNFLAGPDDDTRTPLRFSLVAERAGDLDLDAAEVKAFIGLLGEKEVVVDPTVTILDGMFRHRSGQVDPSYAMVAAHMPPSIRRGMMSGDLDITDENAGRYARSADALLDMIRRLNEAGVTLVAGTDAMPGFTLHRELELYQKAGIDAAEVLRIATIGSARVAGKQDSTGSVAIGKAADFVLLAADPLEDISAVRQVVAVFKGDRWYDASRLYEAVGIRPFTR